MENKICIGCKFNKYPICLGIKMYDGKFMNIENLSNDFMCGQKDYSEITDFSNIKKSVLDLKINSLENRIKELEKKFNLIKH